MSDQRRSMNARRESSPPGSRIVAPHRINHPARQDVNRSRGETLTQQPCRLHCHADSLGNDGMGFAGGVANKKNAVESTPPDAGPNRPSRQPLILQSGTLRASRAARQDCLICASTASPAFTGPAQRRALSSWSRRMQQDRLTRPWSLWTIPAYPPGKARSGIRAAGNLQSRKCALR